MAEFYRGSRSIRARNRLSWARAAIELTHRNTRRYGRYLVHAGIAFMFVGFTGAAFNQNSKSELRIGGALRVGHYDLRLRGVVSGDTPNYAWQRALLDVYRNGARVGSMEPERRYFGNQPMGEVAIRHRLNEDLYVNFAGMTDSSTAIVEAYIFPLVNWIWIGSVVLIAGTLIALVPSKVRRQFVNTELVGIKAEDAVEV